MIVLTGMGNEAVAVEAMKCGAKDYLPKDSLDAPSLVRAITSALERKWLEEQVARYTDELREKNTQMETDLNLAREIQLAFLPHQYPTFPRDAIAAESALHFDHRYHPTSAVGGDFFSVLPISDTEAGVLICDVMGHGVRAALVTAMLRGLAEELLTAAAEPEKFLTEINHRLLAVLTQTRSPMFASAFYAVIDLARGELRYSNAGHPNPLLVRRSAGLVEPLECPRCRPGPALGVFEESMYPLCRKALARHDLIMLFTDGIYEVEGAADKEYGQERLLGAVRQRVDLPVGQLFDELLADVHCSPVNKVSPTTSASSARKSSVWLQRSDGLCTPGYGVLLLSAPVLNWSGHGDGDRGWIDEAGFELESQTFAERLYEGQPQPAVLWVETGDHLYARIAQKNVKRPAA